MFADKIGESSNTTGTGTFSLAGAYGYFRTFLTGFSTGSTVFYYATNDTGSIWELGYGVITTGSPATLTRTLLASSSGALISWATTPYRIFNVPSGPVLAALVSGGLGTALPAWAPAGFGWLDYTLGLAVGWVKKRRTGTVDIEEGRFDIAKAIYLASPRRLWEDQGAAGKTVNANDIGKALLFDCTAAVRTVTLLPSATAKHGFSLEVMAYGSTSNGLTITPDGSDALDLPKVPANGRARIEWDGAKSRWRVILLTARPPAKSVYGLTWANNAGDATNDIDIAAGGMMDDTGVDLIEIAATTKQLDVTWAVDTGSTPSGMLGTSAAIGNVPYDLYAIKNPTTGATAVIAERTGTALTLPSGHTLKAKFGWIKRSGGAIVAFKTYEMAGGGVEFKWVTSILDSSRSGTLGSTRILETISVPVGLSVVALLTTSTSHVGTVFVRVTNPDETAGTTSFTAVPLANTLASTSAGTAMAMRARTNTSAQVSIQASGNYVDTFLMQTDGFEWSRR